MSQLPVLDQRILDDLGAELADPDGARRFVGTYAQLLPQRIGAVEAALASRDTEAAVVALLSLHVSSSMVGARRLEEISSTALAQLEDTMKHPGLLAHLRDLSAEFQSVIGGIIR